MTSVGQRNPSLAEAARDPRRAHLRRGGAKTRAAIIITLALFAIAAWAAMASTEDGPRVVVRDTGGAEVVEADLPGSGRFALTYRHSVYRAPAEERFRATGDGFVLEAIASPSEAVLDYYALEGRRMRRGILVLDQPARFHDMALAATNVGRRTLVVGSRRYPLWRRDGARHLRITVKG
jgi:hypothetical protein